VRAEEIDSELLDAWLKDYTMSELRAREMLEAPAGEDDEVSRRGAGCADGSRHAATRACCSVSTTNSRWRVADDMANMAI
jgi:hypothetical protein